MSMSAEPRSSAGDDSPEIPKYEYLFKVILVGDMGVGKSSLLDSFTKTECNPDKSSNIGTDYKSRSMYVQGKPITLHIWDMLGQETYKTLTSQFYRDAHGALILYDITNGASFPPVRQWFQVLDMRCGKYLPKVLIGNKNDLSVDNRDVQAEQGAEFARNLGNLKPPFLEISAIKEQDAEKAFVMLVNEILSNPLFSSQANVRDSIILKSNIKPIHDPKESGCCK